MKKAIIIGATSGIGKGLAKLLADNNYKISLTGRRVELLNVLQIEKNRAERIFEQFERDGILSPKDNNGIRKIIIS